MRTSIVLPLLALLLSACGYKGALYLPTPSEHTAAKPEASTPTKQP